MKPNVKHSPHTQFEITLENYQKEIYQSLEFFIFFLVGNWFVLVLIVVVKYISDSHFSFLSFLNFLSLIHASPLTDLWVWVIGGSITMLRKPGNLICFLISLIISIILIYQNCERNEFSKEKKNFFQILPKNFFFQFPEIPKFFKYLMWKTSDFNRKSRKKIIFNQFRVLNGFSGNGISEHRTGTVRNRARKLKI